MLAVKLTSVAEAGASWAGTTDETDMAEQLPWLEQYCLCTDKVAGAVPRRLFGLVSGMQLRHA
jgi:hypothetical protein